MAPMTSRLVHSMLVAFMLAGAPAWADVGRDEAAAAAQ